MTRLSLSLFGAALLAGFASAQALNINGSAGTKYPASTVFQTNPTGFGDSNLGDADNANGSELDGVFAQFTPGFLNIIFTGNLETNFNKLEIFFDVNNGTAGQNRLRGNNPNIDFDGLNRMGDDGTGNGLTFQNGFAADYYLTVGIGGGNPANAFLNFATLPTMGGGTGMFLGQTNRASNGVLSGGINPDGLLFNWNNSNVAGVTSTTVGSPQLVTTGLEFAIPTSMIGNVNFGTGVRIAAFINGSDHGFLSNQVLSGLPNGTGNLGDPRNVNFNNFAGNQFFAVPEPASMAVLGLGALGLLGRRRRRN